jgi:hypothetical protein
MIGGKYRNPWPSFEAIKLRDVVSAISMRPPTKAVTENDGALPRVVSPNFEDLAKGSSGRIMWLGHASVYLQIPDPSSGRTIGVLFDPILSQR